MLVEHVSAYKTSDGQIFESLSEAEAYEDENDCTPKMSPTQHQRLLLGVLDILDEHDWNGLGKTVLESLQAGITNVYVQLKDLKSHVKDLNGVLRRG